MGVRGVENLTVEVLVTTLVGTLATCCEVVVILVANCLISAVASTDCGALCRFSLKFALVFPVLLVASGKELAVVVRDRPTTDTLGASVVFLASMDLMAVWGVRSEESTVDGDMVVVTTSAVDGGTLWSSNMATLVGPGAMAEDL